MAVLTAVFFMTLSAAQPVMPPLGPSPEPSAQEADAMNACILEAGPEAAIAQCRGRVFEACVDQPGGETTAARLACLRRESSIWTGQLETAEAALAAALEDAYTPSRPDAFDAAQQAWRAYMRAECRQQSLMFEGGRFEAVRVAGCVMRLTSERAVDLQGQLAELEA